MDDILDIHKYLKKNNNIKMFGFIKKAFCTELTILLSVNPLSAIPLSATPLKCVSMTNQ